MQGQFSNGWGYPYRIQIEHASDGLAHRSASPVDRQYESILGY
jgi:hypothetical protein